MLLFNLAVQFELWTWPTNWSKKNNIASVGA